MYVRTYVRMYVCMYVCMYVYKPYLKTSLTFFIWSGWKCSYHWQKSNELVTMIIVLLGKILMRSLAENFVVLKFWVELGIQEYLLHQEISVWYFWKTQDKDACLTPQEDIHAFSKIHQTKNNNDLRQENISKMTFIEPIYESSVF